MEFERSLQLPPHRENQLPGIPHTSSIGGVSPAVTAAAMNAPDDTSNDIPRTPSV